MQPLASNGLPKDTSMRQRLYKAACGLSLSKSFNIAAAYRRIHMIVDESLLLFTRWLFKLNASAATYSHQSCNKSQWQRLHCFLAFWNILTLVKSECDHNLCVAGCGSFDARLNSCNFDHQVYSSYEKCVCAGVGSPRDNEHSLVNCLSCGTDTPGTNLYTQYESWAVTCGEYELAGEAAAISIDNAPAASVSAFFSTQVLPIIQSICPQAAGGSSQFQQSTSSSPHGQTPQTSSLYTGNDPYSTTSTLTSTQGGPTTAVTQQASQPSESKGEVTALSA